MDAKRADEFRTMAEEMRATARNQNNATTRLAMITIADDYERIAVTLDSIIASKAALEKERCQSISN